ncbi:MAG: peptide-methionine (S)-S-oxide reductase MsrA [Vicinamibacterales bacterium]
MLFADPATLKIPSEADALPGRDEAITLPNSHYVHGRPIAPPFPDQMIQVVFGMGCFWGAERKFWQQEGVYTTAVGYAGGATKNATYQEVCSGRTGHTEVVLAAYDPTSVPFELLLHLFWESHDPTQGMRQGNDVGTQYRSAIFVEDAGQLEKAEHSRRVYQERLTMAGYGVISTEIRVAPPFYYAEEYHQQYLAKNPAGYCGLGGTGVSCSVDGLLMPSE